MCGRPVVKDWKERRFGPCRAVVLVLAVLLLGSCGGRYGRFNPTVAVDVRHPPSVGFLVEEVVFAPPDPSAAPPDRSFLARLEGLFTRSEWLDPGACRAELEQALTQMFIEGGLRVTRYGSHENADAMIGLDVTRCVVGQDREETTREVIEEFRGNTRRREVREYRALTQLDFTALFEVTDLWSDRVVASRTLAFAPELVDSSLEDYPDYPPTGAVLQLAYALAAEDIGPVLLEQVETRNLIFFDDERCGLDRAFRALEAGNYDRALELSLANVASCRPDPVAEITQEDVAAANYNVGVLYRIMGDFDSAMENLERARQADPANSVVADAINETISAEVAAADLMAAAGGAATTTAAGGVSPTSETAVENSDRAALVALYEATDGPSWSNNDGWLGAAPLGDWYGVETDGFGRVTWLNLNYNDLSGPIPPELGSLTNLTELWLYANTLSGPIPPELEALDNLKRLALNLNQLTGPIPPELGNLRNLTSLEIAGNELSGSIPPELGSLGNLTLLDLSFNELSGPIPSELGNLANLTGLSLQVNNLSGPVPSSFLLLNRLEYLHLWQNSLCMPGTSAFATWLLQRIVSPRIASC